jgi:hypothetical protein
MIAQVTVREVSGEHWQMTLEAGGVEWVKRSILCQLTALPVTLGRSFPGAARSEKTGPT